MMNYEMVSFLMIVFSSLICVLVLFKILKSTGVLKGEKTGSRYKLGGAVVGFIWVFGLLSNSYINYFSSNEAETWELRVPYEIIRVDTEADRHKLEAYYVPESPLINDTLASYISVTNVKKFPGEDWPELMFSVDGYMNVIYKLKFKDNTDATDNEYDKIIGKRTIELGQEIQFENE